MRVMLDFGGSFLQQAARVQKVRLKTMKNTFKDDEERMLLDILYF